MFHDGSSWTTRVLLGGGGGYCCLPEEPNTYKSLREKTTPYEKWYGWKPDLSHLRVFGCMAYAYIPDSNRKGKLSKNAEKLCFIRYSLQTKGYRLIDENTSKGHYTLGRHL